MPGRKDVLTFVPPGTMIALESFARGAEMKIRNTVWAFSLAILGLFPGLAVAQPQLTAMHDDISGEAPHGGQMPCWTNNLLAGCDPCQRKPVLVTVDERGVREFVHLDISDADYTAVYNVAAGPVERPARVAHPGVPILRIFLRWHGVRTLRLPGRLCGHHAIRGCGAEFGE